MNQEQIVSLLRNILTGLGTVLVTKGYLDAGQLQMLIGAVLTLGSLGWALYSNRKTGVLLSAAAQLKTGERIVLTDPVEAAKVPSAKVIGP